MLFGLIEEMWGLRLTSSGGARGSLLGRLRSFLSSFCGGSIRSKSGANASGSSVGILLVAAHLENWEITSCDGSCGCRSSSGGGTLGSLLLSARVEGSN